MPAVAQVTQCARHPEVETALRCSRCETPICPRCLVHTPVGARCRDCARIGRSRVYQLSVGQYLLAGLSAGVGGLLMGVAWRLILLPYTVGFFAIFIGAGLGYAFTRLLEFATGHKRGPTVVGFAIAGIGIAWGILFATTERDVALPSLVAVGIGIYFAYQNLR
jgi:hypothetical protein